MTSSSFKNRGGPGTVYVEDGTLFALKNCGAYTSARSASLQITFSCYELTRIPLKSEGGYGESAGEMDTCWESPKIITVFPKPREFWKDLWLSFPVGTRRLQSNYAEDKKQWWWLLHKINKYPTWNFENCSGYSTRIVMKINSDLSTKSFHFNCFGKETDLFLFWRVHIYFKFTSQTRWGSIKNLKRRLELYF